ncbi:hypothetical protein M3Y98_00284200 [Aphelenchoides besseyi]|nr:hypothetical protein M3Y98_00284200 [Aphelenchoides besseyi]KAI6201070.1 hypothetical protein M3Y96_00802300 [Aphelenchoides besseyi]
MLALNRQPTYIVFFLSILASTNAQPTCNYITLIKCFVNILDDWTWTLYELKENVVTINSEQCEHLRQLDKCIQDDGPDLHNCEHDQIIEASNTVTDMLTHRKNSGTFLKSYYLLTYACSPEGQELLTEHRSCLSRERIGEMTLSAGTYLSEKFLEHPDDQVCTEVNNKLQEYMDAMSGLCQEEASQIMCKSLVNMFKGLHADRLSQCSFKCLRPATTVMPIEEEEISDMQAESDSLNASTGSQHLLSGLLLITGMAFIAR